jgi:hypothetical protein
VVNRDSVITETEDTVKLAKGESESGLLGSLGELLLLDSKVTNDDSVRGDETLERTGSVVDGELCSVGLVGRRGGRIVLGVELKSQTSPLM